MPSFTSAVVVVLLTLAPASGSIAGPLSWLSKAGRTAGKAAPKVAAVAGLSRARVLALGSALGAGTVVLEARGGRLLLEAADLGVTGLEGTLDDLGQLTNRVRSILPDFKPQYLISAESADELGPRLDILLESGTVYIAEPGGNAALVVTRRLVGAQSRYFKELRPNVLVPLETPITPEAAEALAVPLRRGNLTIVSAFGRDDVDAVQKLATAAGDRLEPIESLVESIRTESFERFRNQTVIVVGHVENGAFVTRDAAGRKVSSIDIAELEQLATRSDTQLLSAGCYSSCVGARAGFVDAVTDTEMAQAVRLAFDAETNADLLEAFATARPLVISEEALQQFATSHTLYLDEMAAGSGAARTGAVTVRLSSKVAMPAALSEILEVIGSWYLIGLVALIFMFKTSWAALLDVFPRLPSPDLPETQTASLLAGGGRAVLLGVVGPVVSAITVFTFLFGGWPYRQRTMTWLWGWLRYPLRQARHSC